MKLQVELRLKDGLSRISQAQLMNAYSPLRRDLSALLVAGFLGRLFLAALEVQDGDSTVFELLDELLEALSAGLSPQYCALWGQERLLRELGLSPYLEACLSCGASEVAGFSPLAGGVLCASCYGGDGFALTPAALGFCRSLRAEPLGSSVDVSDASVRAASRLYKEHFVAQAGLAPHYFKRVLPSRKGKGDL